MSITPVSWPASIWLDTAPENEPNPPLKDTLRADVAIIGAGFTGLRAALALAEAGSEVAVIDSGDVGWGASGRNGGQVNPMLPFNSPTQLQSRVGPTRFEQLAEVSLNSADELFALIDRYQIDCRARQAGWLRVLHSDAARRKAEADLHAWNRFGAGMEMLSGSDLSQRTGTKAYDHGVLTPRGGAVQPLMLARGVAQAAKARGARIFGQTPAQALERRDGAWIIRTPHGTITSEQVIVATNGYSAALLPDLPKTIIPLTPIQIATAPLPDSVAAEILPEGHTISDSRRVIMYARREPDNRMVYGGLGRMDRRGGLSGFDWLKRDACRVYPQLEQAEWTHEWGGTIAITDDHLPHLHEPEPGLLIGLGYNGRGVAMSHVMGRVLAERALGAPPESLPFPITPPRRVPLRALKLAGMETAIRAMRLMDRLER
ncbi:NAD(P)/FAD-dependent oxidoreductase [Ruegeria jejuensis]|uniref:NAD(P)/FAD-dependent oxidoreductase n=1 Tax=Ruegeria jejuensis TaxID=3233338 RepID=UPI00355B2988